MNFKKFIIGELESAVKHNENIFIKVDDIYYDILTWGKDYIYCVNEKECNDFLLINLNKTKNINLVYRYN